jgi:hypothetical protein
LSPTTIARERDWATIADDGSPAGNERAQR